MNEKLSPMMKHYLTVKEQYPDAIVFYRLGDFYEMFFEDARTASKILDLTLTGRDCGLEERAPMCGVPEKAAETYISKLIEAGQNVAICEQTSDPAASKGLVDRQVVRVVTPGTVVEENLLTDTKNNYLASVCFLKSSKIGLSWTDITTGEFYTAEMNSSDELCDLLESVSPSEIIANESALDFYNTDSRIKSKDLPRFRSFLESAFSLSSANTYIGRQYGQNAADVFELKGHEGCICSAGALILYIEDTQKRSVSHLQSIKKIIRSEYMTVDGNTRRNLEITRTMRGNVKKGTLLSVIDKTETGMGARNLAKWLEMPLKDAFLINKRLDAVEEIKNSFGLTDKLKEKLSEIRDLERLASRVFIGKTTPKDCIAIAYSLDALPELKNIIKGLNSTLIKEIYNDIDESPELSSMLKAAIDENAPASTKDGGFIKAGFNAQLDEYRNIRTNGTIYIAELEAKEKEATGIKNLKINYNRVFGYYIEITNSYKDKVPFHYTRKQTLTGSERYITQELKDYENTVLSADENSLKLELKIFGMINEHLKNEIGILQKTAHAIANLDVLYSFAKVAGANKYTRPEIGTDIDEIFIKDGRHPVIETLIPANQFIANDTQLDGEENRTLVITGPNMAGKSTYMRQVALITLMAHIGCFVPAKHARISLTDRIFTRVGAGDDLTSGQSTFLLEMLEMATILQNATEKSLVILDEIGRGTSTCDGLAIAWSVLEKMTADIKSKTLFSTHYHELAELEGLLTGIKNYKIIVSETSEGIVFLHKIMRGGANKSFGIEVASIAGVPRDVTERAKEIAAHLEEVSEGRDTHSLMLDRLNLKNAVQPDFFGNEKTESIAEKRLREVDINNTSPIEALAILAELKGLL